MKGLCSNHVAGFVVCRASQRVSKLVGHSRQGPFDTQPPSGHVLVVSVDVLFGRELGGLAAELAFHLDADRMRALEGKPGPPISTGTSPIGIHAVTMREVPPRR